MLAWQPSVSMCWGSGGDAAGSPTDRQNFRMRVERCSTFIELGLGPRVLQDSLCNEITLARVLQGGPQNIVIIRAADYDIYMGWEDTKKAFKMVVKWGNEKGIEIKTPKGVLPKTTKTWHDAALMQHLFFDQNGLVFKLYFTIYIYIYIFFVPLCRGSLSLRLLQPLPLPLFVRRKLPAG